MSIAPKKRATTAAKTSDANPLSGAQANANTAASSSKSGPKYDKYARRRALPVDLFSLPTLSSSSSTAPTSSSPQPDGAFSSRSSPRLETGAESEEQGETETIAWVSPPTFWGFAFPSQKDDDVDEPPPPLAKNECFGPVYIRALKGPVDPLADDSPSPSPAASASGSGAGVQGQSQRVIHSAEGSKIDGRGKSDAQAQGKERKLEEEALVLRWSGAVPDGHVVFQGVAEVRDWERW